MDKIIICSITFEIIGFILLLALSKILCKYIQIINIKFLKNNSEIRIGMLQNSILVGLSLCFIISSIVNLISKSIILFIIYMILLILINVYIFIKRDIYVSCFMMIYAIINIIMATLGLIVKYDIKNIFEAYIVTIFLSPLSYSENISFIFIILISLLMLINIYAVFFYKRREVKYKILKM